MAIEAARAKLPEILALRPLHLQEMAAQVRYDAVHERGWSDSYLLRTGSVTAGYGAVKGREREGRDTIFEFCITPPFRAFAQDAFEALVAASGATFVEAQTNDPSLAPLFEERCRDTKVTSILFADHAAPGLMGRGATVRPRTADDVVFEHTAEPVGDLVLVEGGTVVATGGFLTHYNFPFADVHMEVREDRRRRGLGSFLVQEVKKACYLAGRIPAARCGPANEASKSTLLRAGFRVAGQLKLGSLSIA